MISFWKRNKEIHGAAMVLFVGFVYFAQGARDYVETSLEWIFNYELNLESSETAIASAWGNFPWNFKFLIGLVSDNLPIMGLNAKPYLFLAAIMGIVSLSMMGIRSFTPSKTSVTVAFVFMQWYGAVSDCLCDAIVVKNGRNDEEDSTSALQSISWGSLGLGIAVFYIVGGYMSTDFSNNPQNEGVDIDGARTYNIIMISMPVILLIFLFFIREEKTRITPGLKALGQQVIRLGVAIFAPPYLTLRVSVWVLLARASHISLGGLMGPWKNSVIEISPFVQGAIDSSSGLFLFLGVVVYYKWFRRTSFRRIYLFSQIFTAVIYMTDYILIERINVKLGLPDIPFLFVSTALSEVINRLNAMPFLVMAGMLCPLNMEATFFSGLMSISNMGSTVSRAIGAKVLAHYKIDKKTGFVDAEKPILIRSAALVLVCVFLFLLPDTNALDAANVETLAPTNPTFISILKWADMYNPKASEKASEPKKVEDAKV